MKKLLSILASIGLLTHSISIVSSCGKENDQSQETNTVPSDVNKIEKIEDQTMYEAKTKIVVVRSQVIIKDAEISAISENEGALSVSVSNAIDSESKGFFEVTLKAKTIVDTNVKVKYGDFESSFNVKVLGAKHDEPSTNELLDSNVQLNSSTPEQVIFANPVKDANYEVIVVDKDLVSIENAISKDSSGNGEVTFRINGLKLGKTKILINYEYSQVSLYVTVVEKYGFPFLSDYEKKVTIIKSTEDNQNTITKYITVNNPISNGELELSTNVTESLLPFKVEKVVEDLKFVIFKINITSGYKKEQDVVVNLKYMNKINETLLVDIIDEHTIKLDVEQTLPIEVSEGRHKLIKLDVTDRFKNAKINVVNENASTGNIDAFAMNDYDTDTNEALTIVVYGLKVSKENVIEYSYNGIKFEIKINIIVDSTKKPSISGIKYNDVIKLNTNSGTYYGIYIDNPLTNEIISVSYDNENLKGKFSASVEGHNGASYYNLLLVSGKDEVNDDAKIKVTLKYKNADDLSFFVTISSKKA
ncbi:hypothetical protein SCORR_v1c03230 [Spiroplasma corruscae]|uniref:Lipoprotein n=1 Tax=Spiroplasma corruscae TaxID=216934 RepID=A0A222ENN1_9MOLU|nr:hypothetical protein [Spiroplasma corruscae]ASP28097.1 hypothetical protein SCORR_v1c03230 [Spiroplasma corruscae]